ncbi:MAG: hypothetical protein JOZ01_01485, partial [Candidatus Eremiobacteraeota bacterium]|nr:hypothetical protein [Candidatus Eremiobacteraeota bacterium]
MTTTNAVEARGISKRFRFPVSGRPATLKDVVLRRIHFEGHYGIVDALRDVSFTVGR